MDLHETDQDSDEEIFFGTVTEIELKKREKLLKVVSPTSVESKNDEKSLGATGFPRQHKLADSHILACASDDGDSSKHVSKSLENEACICNETDTSITTAKERTVLDIFSSTRDSSDIHGNPIFVLESKPVLSNITTPQSVIHTSRNFELHSTPPLLSTIENYHVQHISSLLSTVEISTNFDSNTTADRLISDISDTSVPETNVSVSQPNNVSYNYSRHLYVPPTNVIFGNHETDKSASNMSVNHNIDIIPVFPLTINIADRNVNDSGFLHSTVINKSDNHDSNLYVSDFNNSENHMNHMVTRPSTFEVSDNSNDVSVLSISENSNIHGMCISPSTIDRSKKHSILSTSASVSNINFIDKNSIYDSSIQLLTSDALEKSKKYSNLKELPIINDSKNQNIISAHDTLEKCNMSSSSASDISVNHDNKSSSFAPNANIERYSIHCTSVPSLVDDISMYTSKSNHLLCEHNCSNKELIVDSCENSKTSYTFGASTCSDDSCNIIDIYNSTKDIGDESNSSLGFSVSFQEGNSDVGLNTTLEQVELLMKHGLDYVMCKNDSNLEENKNESNGTFSVNSSPVMESIFFSPVKPDLEDEQAVQNLSHHVNGDFSDNQPQFNEKMAVSTPKDKKTSNRVHIKDTEECGFKQPNIPPSRAGRSVFKSRLNNYENIVSPIKSYIEGNPSPALMKKLRPERALATGNYFNSPSNSEISVWSQKGNIKRTKENFNNSASFRLPKVKYTSAPAVKVNEAVEPPDKKIRQFLKTKNAKVVKHAGRAFLTPMKLPASPLDEVSVLVSSTATRSDTLKSNVKKM